MYKFDVLTPGGEPIPLDAWPVVLNPNFLAVEVLRSQLVRTPFEIISFLSEIIPSPSNGCEPKPLKIFGSSIIEISLLNICLFN